MLLIEHLNGIFLNSLVKVILNIFSLGGTWIRGRPNLTVLLMSPITKGGRIWLWINGEKKSVLRICLWEKVAHASLNCDYLQWLNPVKPLRSRTEVIPGSNRTPIIPLHLLNLDNWTHAIKRWEQDIRGLTQNLCIWSVSIKRAKNLSYGESSDVWNGGWCQKFRVHQFCD